MGSACQLWQRKAQTNFLFKGERGRRIFGAPMKCNLCALSKPILNHVCEDCSRELYERTTSAERDASTLRREVRAIHAASAICGRCDKTKTADEMNTVCCECCDSESDRFHSQATMALQMTMALQKIAMTAEQQGLPAIMDMALQGLLIQRKSIREAQRPGTADGLTECSVCRDLHGPEVVHERE